VKWGKQVVAAWNGSHPSGQVSAEEIPAGKSSEEVIGASITAGNTPCLVFNTAPAAVPQFQKQGGLVALDSFSDGVSYIQQRTGPRADQYKSPDGRFYQMPWKTNPVMIFYNKQAFQKAGINTANPPLKTYSEFLQTAKTVVAKGGVKAAIWPAPSSEFFQPWFDFYPLFIAQTGKQLVADGQPQFNNPDGVAVGSFWKQLYDQKLAPRELYNGDAFGDQKAAMAIVGPLLFPEPVRAPDGRPAYAMLHRPTWDLSWVSPDAGEPLPAGVHDPRPGIWVSFAPVEEVARDPRALAHFTQHRPVFAFQNLASDEHLPPDHWFWNPETSGGIFVEHGVHFFDAAAWLLGSHPCEVQALEVARGEHGAVDTAIAATLHPGGATATYTHIFTHPEQAEYQQTMLDWGFAHAVVSGWIAIQLHLEAWADPAGTALLRNLRDRADELLEVPGFRRSGQERIAVQAVRVDGRPELWHGSAEARPVSHHIRLHATLGHTAAKEHVYRQSVRAGIADLAAAVRTDREPLVTTNEAWESLATAVAARQAAQSGQRVSPPTLPSPSELDSRPRPSRTRPGP